MKKEKKSDIIIKNLVQGKKVYEKDTCCLYK